jgi:uncharacterized OB-fold protein
MMERTAPAFTDRSADYWQSGADGILRIARCQSCGHYLHPPLPACRRCHGQTVRFEPVSGEGSIYSWTINRYQWTAGMEPPYVLAQVELVEQKALLVMTNIVDCNINSVFVGQRVSVQFERAGESWVPVFRP